MREFSDISALVGKTFHKVINDGDEAIDFHAIGETFRMHHHQSCCESVTIEEIHGDLSDLENTPIIEAREDSNSSDGDWGSTEWTFYNIRTIKGSVTIRWYGTSNGYYSTSVSIDRYTVDG